MQQLLRNLGRVKRSVAPTTQATMLLMPSKATQAFLKCTIEENPQITNNELVSEVEKASKVYARYYVNGNLQDPAPNGQPWCLEAAFYIIEALP